MKAVALIWKDRPELGSSLSLGGDNYAVCDSEGFYVVTAAGNITAERDMPGATLAEKKAVGLRMLRRAGLLPSVIRKSLPPKLRFSILRRDGFRCHYCGADSSRAALEVDHIVPVAQGGLNEPANLITACEACNQGKTDIAPGVLN